MKSLINFAKEKGAINISKVNGPNGAFISLTLRDNTKMTLPVGKRSQAGTISEYNILIASDTNQAIATVNHYEEVETFSLETISEAINA